MDMFGNKITFLIGPEAQAPFFTSNDSVMSQREVYGFMKSVFGKVSERKRERKRERKSESVAIASLIELVTLTYTLACIGCRVRLRLEEAPGPVPVNGPRASRFSAQNLHQED